MNVEPGVYGAKRVTLKEVNPRASFIKLLEAHPTASQEEITRMHWKLVKANQEIFAVLHEYWAANTFKAFNGNNIPSVKTKIKTLVIKSASPVVIDKEKIKAHIAGQVLDWSMPNGKFLKECTFKEVGQFSGWFAKIASAGKPDQIVGEVLTESAIKELLK